MAQDASGTGCRDYPDILFFRFDIECPADKVGLMDIKGIIAALIIIFLVAPVIGVCLGRLPLDTGVIIGIFLVAVMPTTLSSGVVMTGAAGGNMAQALASPYWPMDLPFSPYRWCFLCC